MMKLYHAQNMKKRVQKKKYLRGDILEDIADGEEPA
jgi:hypothetical protein